jgi:hypothetical protein
LKLLVPPEALGKVLVKRWEPAAWVPCLTTA